MISAPKPCKPRFKTCRTARRRLAPLEIVGPTEHVQTAASNHTLSCGECGKTVVGAAVVRDKPRFVRNFDDGGYTGDVVLHRIYCSCCNHVIARHRVSNLSGTDLGDWVGPVEIFKDSKYVERFLAKHPEARGVEM